MEEERRALGVDYLEFDGTTVTVHGRISVNRRIAITGNVTITGEAGSSLEGTGTGFNFNTITNGTLTLAGSVDFTSESLQGNDPSTSRLTTTSGYSGRLVIGASSQTVLDVKNSASIEIGVVTYSDPDNPPQEPMTLKSAGDITLENASLQWPNAVLEGKNVLLSNNRLPVFEGNSLTIRAEGDVIIENKQGVSAIVGSAEISAGDTVVISSAGAPVTAPAGGTGGLTVKNAESVSIEGELNDADTPVISVPATFENCKEVTITKYGEGTVVKEDLVTTDTPVILDVYGEGYVYAFVPGKGIWEYHGELFGVENLSDLNGRACYKVNEGWAYYEPPAAEGGAATLTLENVTYMNDVECGTRETRIVVKGSNTIEFIESVGPLTVDQTGGKLNAIVTIIGADDAEVGSSTVYGDAVLKDDDIEVDEKKTLTIPSGTSLRIDEESALEIENTANLTIGEGAKIINEGEVRLRIDPDDLGDIPTYIKSLNLTGPGTVTVEDPDGNSTEYTNSGVKLLSPAGQHGTLDLSSVSTSDESHWSDQGYKWEGVEADDNGEITSGTLILAEGFNADHVILPDAAVTVVSQGECAAGKLQVKNDNATKTNLTLSGPGPLKIQSHVEITGGPDNSLTVAENAQVEVTGGITLGAAGSVDGEVTVNGTLIIAQGDGAAAIRTGMVDVGGSGTLRVSGETGLALFGKNNASGGRDYAGAFTLRTGGRFEGDCTDTVIWVYTENIGSFGSLRETDIISVPSGYLPRGCTPEFNEGRTSLAIPGGGPFNISSDNVPPGHTHRWAENWTANASHHWHECAASGCPVTENSGKAGYGEHTYDSGRDAVCNVCGYTRSPEPSGSSSRGGGGGARPTSPITVEPSEHGKVTSDRAGAVSGSSVTLTVLPDSGYQLESLTVTDSRGYQMRLSSLGGGKYAFTMPGGSVTIRAAFTVLEEMDCPSRAFPDLDTGAWYHRAVDYVLRNGLMGGYGNGRFGPNNVLTRAQFAQILYNREGRPAVTGGRAFADVPRGAWCADAVAWAAERGIAGGYGDGRFGPEEPVTREQLAVMLWRYAGSPAAAGREPDFSDADRISGYAREALRWAVGKGVMSGKGGGVLDPKGPATRAQAASMLRNFLEEG